jgi:hypothetical protein
MAYRIWEESIPAGSSKTYTVDWGRDGPEFWQVSSADIWTGRVAAMPGSSVPGSGAFVLPVGGSITCPGEGSSSLAIYNGSSQSVSLGVIATRDIPPGVLTYTPSGVASNVITATRATMWHDEAFVLSGGAIAIFAPSVNQDYGRAGQSPSVNGDTFTQSLMLKAGTYNFYVLGETASDRGLLDWYIDGVNFATGQDWYSAGTTVNVIKSALAITVTGTGRHVLKGVVNGKNGASSGFAVLLAKYWIKLASGDAQELV